MVRYSEYPFRHRKGSKRLLNHWVSKTVSPISIPWFNTVNAVFLHGPVDSFFTFRCKEEEISYPDSKSSYGSWAARKSVSFENSYCGLSNIDVLWYGSYHMAYISCWISQQDSTISQQDSAISQKNVKLFLFQRWNTIIEDPLFWIELFSDATHSYFHFEKKCSRNVTKQSTHFHITIELTSHWSDCYQ